MSTKSFIGVPALAACVFVAPALAQPSNPAGFGTVIDVGTGYPQTSYDAITGLSNTQVNLYPGGGLGTGALNSVGPNVEFNFLGGDIGNDEALSVVIGTPRVNITSGVVSSAINLGGGGALWMGGGQTNRQIEVYSGATIAIEGGVLQRGFQVYSGSTATVTGGTIGATSGIRGSGANTTVNISGGTVPIEASFDNRATLNFSGGSINAVRLQPNTTGNFFGTSFLLDGVPIPGLNIGQAFTISQRTGIFSGVLADGSPFSYNLAGTNTIGSSFFAGNALLTVTLVPAPGAALPLVAAGLLAGRRQR